MYSKITQSLMRSERFKYLVYWVLAAIGAGLFFTVSGLLLLTAIVVWSGLTLMYVHAMYLHAESKAKAVQEKQHAWLQESTDTITALVSSQNEKLTADLRGYFVQMDQQHNSIRGELNDVKSQAETNASEIKEKMAHQAAELNQVLTDITERTSQQFVSSLQELREHGAENYKRGLEQVAAMIQSQSDHAQEAFVSQRVHSDEVHNAIHTAITETNRQAIEELRTKSSDVAQWLNDHQTALIAALQQTSIAFNEATAAGKSEILQSIAQTTSDILQQATAIQDRVQENSQRLQTATEQYAQAIQSLIVDAKNGQTSQIVQVEDRIANQINESAHALSEELNRTAEQSRTAINADFTQIQTTVNEHVAKILDQVEASSSRLGTQLELSSQSTGEQIEWAVEESRRASGELHQAASAMQAGLEHQLSSHFAETSQVVSEVSSGFVQAAVSMQEELTSLTAKAATLDNGLAHARQSIEDVKSNLAHQIDQFEGEIIRNMTASLGSYSERIAAQSEDSYIHIEQQISDLSDRLNDYTDTVTSHYEDSKAELERVARSTGITEQHSRSLMEDHATLRQKQEQVLGDMQSVSMHMNHLRLLLQMLQSGNRAQAERKSNVEVIEDRENKLKVNNTYDGQMLKKSEMFANGKLKYVVEYDKQSKISRTKNYGDHGEELTEFHYYPNEQVKQRIEWVRSKGQVSKLVTRYDENGNKIR